MTRPSAMRYAVFDGGSGSWAATPPAPTFRAAVEQRASALAPSKGFTEAEYAALVRIVTDGLSSLDPRTRAMARSAHALIARHASLAPERLGRALTPRERLERLSARDQGFDALMWLLENTPR